MKTLAPESTERALIRRARRNVAMKTGWMIHAFVYAIVNTGLFALNSLADGPRWHVYPLMGWGLGLAIHGLVTLLVVHGRGEQAMADEVARLRARSGSAG